MATRGYGFGAGFADGLNRSIETGMRLGTAMQESKSRRARDAREEELHSLRLKQGEQSLKKGEIDMEDAVTNRGRDAARHDLTMRQGEQGLERGNLELEKGQYDFERKKADDEWNDYVGVTDRTMYSQIISNNTWAQILENPDIGNEAIKTPAMRSFVEQWARQANVDPSTISVQISKTDDGSMVVTTGEGQEIMKLTQSQREYEAKRAKAMSVGALYALKEIGGLDRLGIGKGAKGGESGAKLEEIGGKKYMRGDDGTYGLPLGRDGQPIPQDSPATQKSHRVDEFGGKKYVLGDDGRYQEPVDRNGNPIPQGEEEGYYAKVLNWADNEGQYNRDAARTIQVIKSLDNDIANTSNRTKRARLAQERADQYARLAEWYEQAHSSEPNSEDMKALMEQAYLHIQKQGKKPDRESVKALALQMWQQKKVK